MDKAGTAEVDGGEGRVADEQVVTEEMDRAMNRDITVDEATGLAGARKDCIVPDGDSNGLKHDLGAAGDTVV